MFDEEPKFDDLIIEFFDGIFLLGTFGGLFIKSFKNTNALMIFVSNNYEQAKVFYQEEEVVINFEPKMKY